MASHLRLRKDMKTNYSVLCGSGLFCLDKTFIKYLDVIKAVLE